MARRDPDAMERAKEHYMRNPMFGAETDCEPRIRELEAEIETLRGELRHTQDILEYSKAQAVESYDEAELLRETLELFLDRPPGFSYNELVHIARAMLEHEEEVPERE